MSRSASAENGKEDVMASWIDWKIKHLDNEEQEKVIKYFKEINLVFEEADNIMWRAEKRDSKSLEPKVAIEIANKSLDRVKKINPPQVCYSHYNLTIEILKSILDYQNIRMILGDEMLKINIQKDEVFESKIRTEQIRRLKLEDERQKEYFRVLHKIGFYNNALQ